MNRVATPGYLRFPHVHADLLSFVAEDDVWLAPAAGGRAWRLTTDGGQASHPRFSPDGARIAWTSWRDGGIPEVYTAELDGGTGGPATRRTYWGDMRTRTTGWTAAGEVLDLPERFNEAIRKITGAVACLGCKHTHIAVTPATNKGGEL